MRQIRTATSGSGTSPARRERTRGRRSASPMRALISMRHRRQPGSAADFDRSAGGRCQVVDGHTIDPGGAEVLLDPLGDLARDAPPAAESATPDEVVDAPAGDVLLE